MRPIKLTMNAFGPFVNQAEIDFSRIDHDGIFLVTGQTGAGKTTIFDAISFALYGSASGSTRESDTFRSDFASPKEETYVEFTFELNQEHYTIRRSPKYLREGYKTENKHQATLTLPNGEIIDGLAEVEAQVMRIIGLSESQFRQIVMIAQGEFTKLLFAESKVKEVIFRKIFSTEIYNQITEELKSRSSALKIEMSNKEAALDEIYNGLLVSHDPELESLLAQKRKQASLILAKLTTLNEADSEKQKEFKKTLDLLEKNIHRQISTIEQCKAVNNDFAEREQLQKRLDELLVQGTVIGELSAKIEQAQRAALVNQFYSAYQKDSAHTQRVYQLSIELNTNQDSLNFTKIEVEEQFAQVSTQYLKKPAIDENINLLNQLLRDIERKSALSTQLKQSIRNADDQRLLETNVLTEKNTIETSLRLAETELKTGPQVHQDRYQTETEITLLTQQINQLTEAKKKLGEFQAAQVRYNQEVQHLQAIESNWIQKNNTYNEAESLLRLSEIGIIANTLMPNEPCPVCGSPDHPHPAMRAEGALSQPELEVLKEEVSSVQKEREKQFTLSQEQKSNVMSLQSVLRQYALTVTLDESVDVKITETEVQRSELIHHVEQLKLYLKEIQQKLVHLEQTEKTSERQKLELEKIQTTLQSTQTKIQSINLQIAAQQAIIESIKIELPEGCLSTEDVVRTVESNKKLSQQLETSYTAAGKKTEEMRKSMDQLAGEIKSNQAETKIASAQELTSKENYLTARSEQGFANEETFKSAILEQRSFNEMSDKVNQYHKDRQVLQERIATLVMKLEGKSLSNIDELTVNLNRDQLDYADRNREASSYNAQLENNKHRTKRLLTETGQLDKLETTFKTLDKLRRASSGQNDKKLSLERYVLAMYFDKILEAANYRLDKITYGRYKFYRREDIGGGARQQGLDLNVLDYETGKERDVKTLSGGESFKAALSLALGCSDVIQSFSGGIELNTLFIDEGFGTLDPESLDQALKALLELKHDNKLIGVISHVQELKDKIDAKIIVKKANIGSIIEYEN